MNIRRNVHGVTPLQEEFCQILGWGKVKTFGEAVSRAGYKVKNKRNASRIAYQLRHNPKVWNRLLQVVRERDLVESLIVR